MEYTHRQLPQLLGPAVRSIEGMRRREAAHGGRWHPRLALVLLMLVLSLCRSGEAKQQHQQRQRRQCLSSLPSMSTARARRRLIGLRGGATAVPTTKAAGVVPVVGNEDEEALVEVRLLRRRPRVVLQLVLAALLGLGVLASLGRVPLLLLASTPIEAAAAEADGSSSTSAATSAASLPALLLLTLSAAANLLYWLVQRWSVAFKVWAGYRTANVPAEASSVLVLPRPHKGEPALLPLTREPAPAPAKGKKKKKAPAAATPAFVYQHRTYQLGRKGFQQRRPALHLPLAHYLREPGPFVGKGGEAKAAAARALYGPNALDVAVPPLKSLLVEEALTPVSVLKLLDLALAAADRGPPGALVLSALQFAGFRLRCAHAVRANLLKLRAEVVKEGEEKGKRGPDAAAATADASLLVLRGGAWRGVSKAALVPGDVMALRSRAGQRGYSEAPADCLVLWGQAVVDEAILTGESLPQLKGPPSVALGEEEEGGRLDMEGQHRPHILFSGTRIVRVEKQDSVGNASVDSFPPLPAGDGEGGEAWLLARVLRTGYFSTQGELLRMIDFRSARIDADSSLDTIKIFVGLGALSLAAAASVVVRGSRDPERSPGEVLLSAIRLLSRGVPFYLLDMLSDTVAQAVAALAHGPAQMLCTEPFRIPLAGRVDTCLFDKTGTITTEHLTLRGLVVPSSNSSSNSGGGWSLVPAQRAPPESQRVLAACHALVEVEGRLAGDSLELSALKGSSWRYDGNRSLAIPPPAAALEEGEGALRIVVRHPFSASLQRMSVVVARNATHGDGGAPHTHMALVKGSPEAMKPLFQPESLPDWYDAAYQSLAMEGTRVLALGYKPLGGDERGEERGRMEEGLVFAGLAAFRTQIRADSRRVIGQLTDAGMALAVVSGDGLLTSLHVARAVGMVGQPKQQRRGQLGKGKKGKARTALVLDFDYDGHGGRKGKKVGSPPTLAWFLVPTPSQKQHQQQQQQQQAATPGRKRMVTYFPERIAALAANYDLCAGGAALQAALARGGGIGQSLHTLKVVARATPELKETLVRRLRTEGGRVVLMCGDGANDVGALKHADCGVAILNGFGAANVEEEEAGGKDSRRKQQSKKKKETPVEATRRKREQQQRVRSAFQKALSAEIDRRKAEVGGKLSLRLCWGAYRDVSKEFFGTGGDAAAAARARLRVEGLGGGDREEDGELVAGGTGAQGEAELDVRLGDASLAAPFTAKSPSIAAVSDLLRQGRASLARAQQQAQQGIAYSLSNLLYHFVLAYMGTRMGRRQVVVLGLLGSFLEVGTRGIVPLQALAAVRPPASVLHPSSLFSVLGQSLIQTGLTYQLLRAVRKNGAAAATPEGGEDGREQQRKLLRSSSPGEPPEPADPLGSLMFLSQMVESAVGTFNTVRGRPFSTGIPESPTLVFALCGLIILPPVMALGLEPRRINARLEVGPLSPDNSLALRAQVALNLVLQLVLPLAWDALMLRTFAPEVYRAIAAARRGRRVDVAGEEMVDQSEEDEDAEENGSKEALAVDNSVLVGNLAKAMGAWALLYLDVVPWENAVAMLSLDPAELAVQALKKQEEEVVAETGEQLSLPLHGSTVNRVE